MKLILLQHRNFSSFPLMRLSVVFFLPLLLTWVHKYLTMQRATSPFSVRLWLIPQIQLWRLLFFEQYLLVLFRLINTASKLRKLYVYNHQFHWLCCAMSSFFSFVRFCFRLTFVSWSNGKSFLNFSQLIFFPNLTFSFMIFCFSPYTVPAFQHLWIFFLL